MRTTMTVVYNVETYPHPDSTDEQENYLYDYEDDIVDLVCGYMQHELKSSVETVEYHAVLVEWDFDVEEYPEVQKITAQLKSDFVAGDMGADGKIIAEAMVGITRHSIRF